MLRSGAVLRDGVTLHYDVADGGSRTAVFLHGLAGCAPEWHPTMAALSPEFTCIALDQRGHGRSTRRPADLSRTAFVDDVVAVLDDALAHEPVVLVGQSMGAHTAMLVAATHPDRIDRLVLVEGDVGGGGRAAAQTVHDALAAWPDLFTTFDEARDFFGGDTVAGRMWASSLEERRDGLVPRFDRDVMDAAMEPVFHRERWNEWQSLRVPTLLVLAERSTIDPTRIDQMCRLRPDVRRVTVQAAGHDLHLDQPEEWSALLRTFLGARRSSM